MPLRRYIHNGIENITHNCNAKNAKTIGQHAHYHQSRLGSSGRCRRTRQGDSGGKTGCRPDRATAVYANRIREAYGSVPIVIGGVYVKPGDLVFGDNDSVVVVPREIALQVLEVAEQREHNEEGLLQRILNGETTTFEMFRANYEKLNLSEEPDQH